MSLSKPLTPPKTADELLDMYYLDLRCHLLETAATMDRLQRAEGYESIQDDPRLVMIQKSLALLQSNSSEKAEEFLNLFSE